MKRHCIYILVIACLSCSRKNEIPQEKLVRIIEDLERDSGGLKLKSPMEVIITDSDSEYYIVCIAQSKNKYLKSSSYIPYHIFERNGILYCFIDMTKRPSEQQLRLLEEYDLLMQDNGLITEDVFYDSTNMIFMDHQRETLCYFVCKLTDIFQKKPINALENDFQLPDINCEK